MMGRVALGMTVRLKLRRQFNVPSSMSMGEAVERIVAESARRNAMYQRNVRALHRVVEQIESRARDFLTIRERMREAQLAFLQRSCNLPVVAMFSSASVCVFCAGHCMRVRLGAYSRSLRRDCAGSGCRHSRHFAPRCSGQSLLFGFVRPSVFAACYLK